MSTGSRTTRSVVDVPVSPDHAFRQFVELMPEWWRPDGPYWNDPERRLYLQMDPGPGGRIVEVYDAATGDGFEIGRIVGWQPGRRLAFLWRQADWPDTEVTEVEVTFDSTEVETADAGRPARVAGETRTLVTLVHSGWERVASDPTAGDGYQEGWDELLGWYAEAVETDARS
jgi:uncharacterized protein YndB with AHSA1/START domain